MRRDDRCIIEGESANRDHLPGASRLRRCLLAYLTQVKRDISREIDAVAATSTTKQARLRYRYGLLEHTQQGPLRNWIETTLVRAMP
jgi:hypothetical protein